MPADNIARKLTVQIDGAQMYLMDEDGTVVYDMGSGWMDGWVAEQPELVPYAYASPEPTPYDSIKDTKIKDVTEDELISILNFTGG